MKEYVSVKEFAEIVGVSVQSVYKRLKKEDNPLQPFLMYENNQLKVDKSAVELIYRKKVDSSTPQPRLKVVEKVEKVETEGEQKEEQKAQQPSSASYEKIIDLLKEELEANRREMEAKNKQIDSLTDRLQELTTMLNQEQQLNALDKKVILQLKGQTEETEGNEEEQKEDTKEKKKGNWFFNLFK